MSTRIVIAGVAAARGMALGRARLVQPSQPQVDRRPLPEAEVEAEVARLDVALIAAREEMHQLRSKLHGALAREVGEFIDAHSLILEDPELIGGLYDLIRKGRYRASAALKMQRDRVVAAFDALDDPYLRSRREDIDHVIGRVQAVLARDTTPAERQIASRVGTVLVSDSVAPAELAHLTEHGVLGVITTGGSALSHSAILARSMRLPMVVGAHEALKHLSDDDLVLVDGGHGEVVVHPTAQDLARYRQYQREQARSTEALQRLKYARTLTADGTEIHLYANAEMSADIVQARALGSAGIGLYRTEFLFLQRREVPDEEEQFAAYRDVVLGMGGMPVTIRTLDLGADKADGTGIALGSEPNPALGVRGVRLSMAHPQLFATQLRAILRAANFGPRAHSRADGHDLRGSRCDTQAGRGVREAAALQRPRDYRPLRIRRDDRSTGRGDRAAGDDSPPRLRFDRHQRPDPVHAGRRSRQRRARHDVRPAASSGAETACADHCHDASRAQTGHAVRRNGRRTALHRVAAGPGPDQFQHAPQFAARSTPGDRQVRSRGAAPSGQWSAARTDARRHRTCAEAHEQMRVAASPLAGQAPYPSCGIIARSIF